MPRVTSLAIDTRRESRYRVVIDGDMSAWIDGELIHSFNLWVGADLEDHVVARLFDGAARLAALDQGVAALAIRARSAQELTRWLAKKGCDPEHAGAAVAQLTSLGLVDDAALARSFARSRAVGRGMSRRRIQAELARRGVARDLVDAAIVEVMLDEGLDERTLAEAAARKKLRSLARCAPIVRRRRLAGFLGRQGFPPGLIRDLLRGLDAEHRGDFGFGDA